RIDVTRGAAWMAHGQRTVAAPPSKEERRRGDDDDEQKDEPHQGSHHAASFTQPKPNCTFRACRECVKIRPMFASDPVEQYLNAASRARAQGVDTAPAALATASTSAAPSLRIVLVRGVDARGFVFFTNYNSRKARELTENP